MSLMISGIKWKIKSSEISNVNINQITGLVDSFETYLDPVQQQNITNINNNIININNSLSNLTNLINNNDINDNEQNTQLTNINNNIININNSLLNLQNNKWNITYVDNQINNINNSINLINNDINDILTKNINYDNFINNEINTLLNNKLNIWVYNSDLVNLYNDINNKQTQINQLNVWLTNLNNTDNITNDQLTLLNNDINYLTPLVNTHSTQLSLLENQTIQNINNSLALKMNISDFNTEKTNINNNINLKWNITDVNNSLALKMNISDFNTEKTNINNWISLKSNTTDVNNSLALKLNIIDINKNNKIYYVSNNSGNDNNSGYNEIIAFKTLWKANTIMGNTGEKLIILDYLNETITFSQLNIEISGYLNNRSICFINNITSNNLNSGSQTYSNLTINTFTKQNTGYLTMYNCNINTSLSITWTTTVDIYNGNFGNSSINISGLNSFVNFYNIRGGIFNISNNCQININTNDYIIKPVISWICTLWIKNAIIYLTTNGEIYNIGYNGCILFLENVTILNPDNWLGKINVVANCNYVITNCKYSDLSTFLGIDISQNYKSNISNVNILNSIKLNWQLSNSLLWLDTNKNITWLNTWTYPSLTELTYLKNVSWPIQTQITNINNSLINTYTKLENDNLLNNKLNVLTYNSDKSNIDNNINNLNLIKMDTSYFNNQIWLYASKTFLSWNHYNKSEIDTKFLDVNNWIQNILLTDIFNINQTLSNLNTFQNITYETNNTVLNNNLQAINDTINNMGIDISNLENYNNTNGNINLSRINLLGSSENKILKVINNILTWWDDLSATATDLTNYYNKTQTDTLLNNKQNTIVDYTLPLNKLYKTGATSGQFLKFDGTNNVWSNIQFSNLLSELNPSYTFINNSNTNKTITFDDPYTYTFNYISLILSRWALSKSFKLSYNPSANIAIFYIENNEKLLIWSSIITSRVDINIDTFIKYTGNFKNLATIADSYFLCLANIKETTFGTYLWDNSIPVKKLVNGWANGQVLTYNTSTGITWSLPTISDNSITLTKLSNWGALANQIIKYDGTNIIWSNESGGGSVADNSILKTKLQTETFAAGDNPSLYWLFYNYYTNKFVSSYDLPDNNNVKITFNSNTQSYIQFIPSSYGTPISYSFGSYYIGPTSQLYGGIGMISDKTGILLRRNDGAMIMSNNGSVLCSFVLGSSSTPDLNSSTYLKSQIQSTGSYYVMSSELRKKNIQIKNNNNVLNRLLNLKIHSYILNDESLFDKVIVGLVINEDLYNNFRNIIINNIPRDVITERQIKENYNDLTTEEKLQLGVDYNTLLCYFILGFQEAYKKQHEFNNKIIQSLKDNDDTILNLMKMKKWEWYSNLLNKSYDDWISDLIKNNELINNKFTLLKNENNDLKNEIKSLKNENFELKKSYDDLFIEIKNIKELLNQKQDLPKTILKKSTTLKK